MTIGGAEASVAGDGHPAPRRHAIAATRDLERLAVALRNNEIGRADRIAKTMACLRPSDPQLIEVSRIWPAGELINTRASFGRMVRFLNASDPTQEAERIHRSIKANRPDLMPPHWMRDVMYEAEKLQALIQDDGLDAALTYLRNPDLAGHRHYMPRFRALRHFVLFNAVQDYRDAFLKTGLTITRAPEAGDGPHAEAFHERVLDGLIQSADWREVTDTIAITDGAPVAADKVRKRIRAGRIRSENLPESVASLKKFIFGKVRDYWNDLQRSQSVPEFFGFNRKQKESIATVVFLNINEILEGPVLGPHYHSGFRYDVAHFALLSGVYYPRTVPEADETWAGYLELGRPDFDLPFEPMCIHHRPVAGDLVLFPAFAYHGVVPIEQSPRYSVNVDAFMKPRSAVTWSVTEFFDQKP